MKNFQQGLSYVLYGVGGISGLLMFLAVGGDDHPGPGALLLFLLFGSLAGMACGAAQWLQKQSAETP